jgi:predicted ester cyclase
VSTESNKAVVERFIVEAWNGGNLDVVDELVHATYAISGLGHGPEAVKRNMQIYRTAFPDLEWHIEQLVAEGEWVAARLTLHGTHLGPLGNIEPTGKRVVMNEMAFWRVLDGKLHAIWSQGDALGIRIQIGSIPATAWDHSVPATADHPGRPDDTPESQ